MKEKKKPEKGKPAAVARGFLTVDGAAEFMGISRRSVYRLMDMHAISYCLVRLAKSTRRRIAVAECERYMTRDTRISNEKFLEQADLLLLEMDRRREVHGR